MLPPAVRADDAGRARPAQSDTVRLGKTIFLKPTISTFRSFQQDVPFGSSTSRAISMSSKRNSITANPAIPCGGAQNPVRETTFRSSREGLLERQVNPWVVCQKLGRVSVRGPSRLARRMGGTGEKKPVTRCAPRVKALRYQLW